MQAEFFVTQAITPHRFGILALASYIGQLLRSLLPWQHSNGHRSLLCRHGKHALRRQGGP